MAATTVVTSVGWVKGTEEAEGPCRSRLTRAYHHEWTEHPNELSHWNDKVSASRVKQSLRLDGFSDTEFKRKGPGQREVCGNHERLVHDKAFFLRNEEGYSFVALLRTCSRNKDLYSGMKIHDDILEKGLLESCSDALVTMYAKCGALKKARELLGMHKCKNVSSWNALIAGYTRKGQGQNALHCFERMQHNGLSPNAITFACVLKACGSLKAIDKGKEIHDEIVRQGLLANDIVLGNALVDMYAKCGMLAKAQGVLEELPSRDVVSWNALITGYAQQGQGKQALSCFEEMQHEKLSPDAVTFICLMKACGNVKAVDKGEKIHDEIARRGLLDNDIVLGTAVVDMYAKCGVLQKAQRVLDKLSSRNVVSWNALISGYVNQNEGHQALKCFERMQCEGLSPDAVTFTCILKACGSIGAANKGEQIHDEISRQGLLGNNIVLGTALVDMYAKCGALEKAQEVLDNLPCRDVVTWNSLIAGYAQKGLGEQALNCFERMQSEGLFPNALTFTSILKACGSIGAVDKGEEIHDEIARQGLLKNDIALGSALVDMYAKCGALAKAQHALEGLPYQDVVSWNALIAGYAHEGQSQQALDCLEQMQRKGLSPNAVTFSSVLNVWCHLGLVEEGNNYFMIMSTKYGMKPTLEHYTCMVDLFGRAGHLDKAVEVIQEMSSPEYSAVWSALLGACRKWGDVHVGRWAFERAIQVDRKDGAAYVLMADIYAAAGMQECADYIEAMRKENEARL